MGIGERLSGFIARSLMPEGMALVPATSVDQLAEANSGRFNEPAVHTFNDGDKFPGGFGPTQLFDMDYWTLRQRSAQLFRENLYARGLIRRLVNNEINTGLSLEACPDANIIGVNEDELNEWAEDVEDRFYLWERQPEVCHAQERLDFGGIQRMARMEAYICGDILVVNQVSRRTGVPYIRLIDGNKIQSPWGDEAKPRQGNRIEHGVELDNQDRHVAFWVRQRDGSIKRMPARGERSGRRIAWLYYGTETRIDDVRGEPLLSIVLQSLKEIDRYRDSAQRKAVVNSILAMFVVKKSDKPGSRPMGGAGARKRDAVVNDTDGKRRHFKLNESIPGVTLDELQEGEEPKGFQPHGTDEKFGDFEDAIITAIAWSHNVPPEILKLAFSNNYSASQAAINEFKNYLNQVRTEIGQAFCQPIYIEWLISEALNNRIIAPRLLDAWRNPAQYHIFGAWISAEWSGAIKLSTDIRKQAQGYKLLRDMGWITNDRAARELTGQKFSRNVKKLKRERELLEEAGMLDSAYHEEAALGGPDENPDNDEE